jgi:hypothetical protein
MLLPWRAFMKTVAVIFVGFFFSMNTLTQEAQKDKPKTEADSGVNVTADARDIEPPKITAQYPACKPKPPKVTLQRALKIAESYIRGERIKVDRYYLAGVLAVYDGAGEVIRWEFTWRSEKEPNVEIDVLMNGKAIRVPARVQSIM